MKFQFWRKNKEAPKKMIEEVKAQKQPETPALLTCLNNCQECPSQKQTGCCGTCRHADYQTKSVEDIKLTCSYSYSIFEPAPRDPQCEHTFKVGEPCYANGAPCKRWQTKFLINTLTHEVFIVPSR